MIDFDEIFQANGLEPLPDPELRDLLSVLSQHLAADDLAAYIVSVMRFDERPMHVTDSHPGEYLLNLDVSRAVYWWHLRKDCAVIPRFMVAATTAGLSYAERVELLRAVVDTNRYDFGGVDGLIGDTADIIEMANKRGISFQSSLADFKRFLVEAKADGEVSRAFGIARLCMVAGMSVEQSLDIVQSIYAGRGIAGYVFMGLWDELETLGHNGVGGDLIYEALKAAHANDIGFQNLTTVLHVGTTQTSLSRREVFEKVVEVLTESRSAIGDHSGSREIVATVADPLDWLANALMPAVSGADYVVKEPDKYFPEIGVEKLVHGVLPYRLERSLRDGLADLRELMNTSHAEGAFVFDPASDTWFSLGGRTSLQSGRARHEFYPYDVSALSQTPVFVHTHPRNNEIFISPARDTLAFPQLQKKLVSFLTAMPSGADFGLLGELHRTSSKPVAINGLILTSQGITEFNAPSDAEDIEAFAGSFKFDKGEAIIDFDAAGYLAKHGIDEADFAFIERLMPAVTRKLPPGFEIALSTFEDFDFDRSYTSSVSLQMAALATGKVGPL
jgi:hypothetical protein